MLAENDHGTGELDPADLAPLCDEAEFAELVDGLVADEALRLPSPERAARAFSRHPKITARVVWVNQRSENQ